MEENRIPVFGKDSEEHDKRAFDWVIVDGKPVVETKDHRTGARVRTPLDKVLAGYERLKQKQAHNATA